MTKWHEKSRKAKAFILFQIAFWLIAATLVILYFTVFREDSGNVFESFGTWLDMQAPVLYKSMVYIVIAVVISKLIRLLLSKLLSLGKRGKTAVNLINNFVRYTTAIVIIIIIMVLIIFGVDPVALFASIGILGLVIGLGAQSLISDIISGLFIVFEGEYEVGDYIVIDGFRGKVLAIGIRTTQLVDYGGNNKIIITRKFAQSLIYHMQIHYFMWMLKLNMKILHVQKPSLMRALTNGKKMKHSLISHLVLSMWV